MKGLEFRHFFFFLLFIYFSYEQLSVLQHLPKSSYSVLIHIIGILKSPLSIEEEKLNMTEPSQQHKQNLSNMHVPFRDTRLTDPLWTDQEATWQSTNNYAVSKES